MKASTFPIRKIGVAVLTLGASLAALPSQAFFVQPVRCETDSLDQTVVEGRNAWFKRCKPELYDMVYSEGNEFTFNGKRFDRRLYVTFGVPNAEGGFSYPGNWMAPTDVNADCKSAPKYVPIGVCTSGCYQGDQNLLFAEGNVEIAQAMEANLKNVVTLSSQATLEKPSSQLSPIRNFLASIRDAQHELLEFRTLSGGALTVTVEHPLLDSEGKMRRADTFKNGEALVQASGQADPIVSIVGKTTFGKVYNLDVQSEGSLENIVIAQGFLNGSLFYQNGGGVAKLNQVIFRQSVLPSGLLE